MFYRTMLVVCCVAAAILMAAIFYSAISALVERRISELDAVWLVNGSLAAAALFSLFGILEHDQNVPSIVDQTRPLRRRTA